MTDWRSILLDQIDRKGRPTVQRELDISSSALSLVLSGKYQASTRNIEKRVMDIYGMGGSVRCRILGDISPAKCIENYKRAQTIKPAGNPRTIRLYMACRKCDFRK